MDLQITLSNSLLECEPPFTPDQEFCEPLDAVTSPPSAIRTNPIPGNPILIGESISEFLYRHLSVGTLNKVHSRLSSISEYQNDIVPPLRYVIRGERSGKVHKPEKIRPLHRHLMSQRQIVVTEDPCLHLTLMRTTVHIKPLPLYLLQWKFFKDEICPDKVLYGYATGLLSTYPFLIQNRSDFKIALESGLVPETMTWNKWSALAPVLASIDKSAMNKRYEYGEIHLRVVNWALLTWGGNMPYGLFRGENRILSQYFRMLVMVFAFLTVGLSARQLAVALRRRTIL